MSALEPKDVLGLIDQIREQTYSISSRQIILDLVETGHKELSHEESYIYKHLHEGFKEDFDTARKWVEGEKRIRFPHVSEHKIGATKIKITVTHRGKAEEIYGVDVLYEIEGKKAAGFQHKKADKRDSLRVDSQQLNKVKRICPSCAWYMNRPRRLLRFLGPFAYEELLEIYHRESYVRPGCSALYVINSPNLGVEGVISACRLSDFLEEYNDNYGEIFKLVKRESIDEAFVKCIVGYDLRYEREGRGPIDNHYDTLYIDQHLIFDVLLSQIERQ